jgi:hypothetical protein
MLAPRAAMPMAVTLLLRKLYQQELPWTVLE